MGEKSKLPEGIEITGSTVQKLVEHRAFRALVFLAVLLLAAYMVFFRLEVAEWRADEPIYRDAGLEYVQAGDFSSNQQHPFLVKYILGVTQVVFGSSEAGVVRVPAAVATLFTGLILFAFARRAAGYWSGVLALALWTISPLTLDFGRVAFLEVFLMLFCTLALYLGWRWAESGSWWFAGLAGVALGLATASKLTGILFLPAILLAGLLKISLSRRLVFQGMLISLAAVATVLATYAPAWSEGPSAIQYMFDFQSRHNVRGHGVTISGVVYQFPPWWTHLWWQWEFYGPLANLSLGAALVIALLRRRSLDLYLLAAALVPFLFLSFYTQVKLAKYFSAWQPVLILVLVLAAGKLARQGLSRRIFAALLLAPFIYLGAQAIQAVSQVQPGQYAAAVEYLKDTSHDKGPTLVWGQDAVVQAYLPKARVINFSSFSERWPRDAPEEEIEVVIVDVEFSRRQPSPEIEEYLAKNRDAFPLAYTTNEKNIEVYARKPEG